MTRILLVLTAFSFSACAAATEEQKDLPSGVSNGEIVESGNRVAKRTWFMGNWY